MHETTHGRRHPTSPEPARKRQPGRRAARKRRTKRIERREAYFDLLTSDYTYHQIAQAMKVTPLTVRRAVDRYGRLPNGQLVANIPRGLDVVSQAFNSDVGVDNDPIQFQGGYVWYDVLGITPSRERPLDEVRDQVEAKWREDQISSRLRTKAAEMVQKLEQGGTLAEQAAAVGSKVESAKDFKREASVAGVPSSASTRSRPIVRSSSGIALSISVIISWVCSFDKV